MGQLYERLCATEPNLPLKFVAEKWVEPRLCEWIGHTLLSIGVSGTNTVPLFFTSGESTIADLALDANFDARLDFSEKKK